MFKNVLKLVTGKDPRTGRESGIGHEKAGRGRNRQSGRERLAPFSTPTGKDFTTISRFHAGTEPVVTLAFEVAGLVGALGRHDKARCKRKEDTEPEIIAQIQPKIPVDFPLPSLLPDGSLGDHIRLIIDPPTPHLEFMDIWHLCLTHLEEELPHEDFHAWLKPIQPWHNNNTLILFVHNEWVHDEINRRYLDRIRELLQLLGGPEDVRLEIGSAPRPNAKPPATPAPLAPPLAGKSRSTYLAQLVNKLDPYYTFDNFVEGRSNELARAGAGLVASTPGVRARNPLLLYGSSGLGKTHLMIAAGNEMRKLHPHLRVLYLRSETFSHSFRNAALKKDMDQFKGEFQEIDVLLIDDIQMFVDMERTQEEFFYTFNQLFERGQQIILTCDQVPREMESLDSRLRSRLSWGLSVLIDPPDFETRAAILSAKAREHHINIPDEVARLLAQRMHSNVRDLEGALNTLAANASLTGRPVTVEFTLETLHDQLRAHQKAVSIPNIQKTVAQYYNLTVAALVSRSRTQTVARARQIGMALARELTTSSLPTIAQHFNKTHTTVLHACQTIETQMKQDGQLRSDWNSLIRKLSS